MPACGIRFWLGCVLLLTVIPGCRSIPEGAGSQVAARRAPRPSAGVSLPPMDTGRVERWLVRSEADRLESDVERRFSAAREAYWDGRTDEALRLWRGMLPDGPFPAGLSAGAVRWLMIQACEESGRWGEAVELAKEFGFDRSHPLRLGLARALAREPEPEFRFAESPAPIPFELKSRHLVVLVIRVNGEKARVLVDTGFTKSFVTEAFASRIGIRRVGVGVVVTDSNGRNREAGMGVVDSLTVSGLTVRHWPVVVGPMGSIARWVGEVDGVVGWDILQRAAVAWDFPACAFTVTRPGSGPLGPPNISGRKVPVLAFTSPDGGPLELFLDSGYASKPPTVSLNSNARLLDSRIARARFRVSLRPSFTAGMHSLRVRWPRRARELPVWFEGWEFVMPCALVRGVADVQEGLQVVDGTVGVAPFLRGTLWLDGARRRAVYLQPGGDAAPAFGPPED